jgi:hypothetical protein
LTLSSDKGSTYFSDGEQTAITIATLGYNQSNSYALSMKYRTRVLGFLCLLLVRFGWRASFYVFGILGVLWSAAWYWWFRDSPTEKAGVSAAELEETRGLIAKAHHGLPWKGVLRSGNFWATMSVAFCYVYTFYFFQSWFHTRSW